jgi:hypothetical protein
VVTDEGYKGQYRNELKGERGSAPNEITPMAWNMPSLIVKRLVPNVPLDSAGTVNPCVTTVTKIIIMLINASVLAFANYTKVSILFPHALEY